MARGLTTKGLDSMLLVRKVITRYVTANPREIQDILRQKEGVKMTQSAINNAIKNLRAEDGKWVDNLAETVYGATIHKESSELEDHIEDLNVRLQQADTGEYASLMNTLLKLYERRQYVMEELALYPRLMSGNIALPQTDIVKVTPDEKPGRKRRRPVLKAAGSA